MTNKTIENRVVVSNLNKRSFLKGFDLVIVDSNNNYTVYNEGEEVKRLRFFPFIKKNEIFGVSNDPNHNVIIRKTILHSDSIHSFGVEFQISFCVNNSRESKILIIKRLNSDPVGRLTEEIIRITSNLLAKLDWEILVEPKEYHRIKKSLSDELVTFINDERTALSFFNYFVDYAQTYGLLLLNIDFSIEIPQEHLTNKIEDERFKINHRIELQKQQLKEELRKFKRVEKIRDAFNKTIENYIETVGSNIASTNKTVEDVIRDIKSVIQIQELFIKDEDKQKKWSLLISDELELTTKENRQGLLDKTVEDIKENFSVEDLYLLINQINSEIIDRFKKGKILYTLSSNMKLNTMEECIVRIVTAELENKLYDGLNNDQIKLAKKNHVQLSPVMAIKIQEPPGQNMFIFEEDYVEQVLNENDFTEWSFYIKPIKKGKGLIIIKVVAKIPTKMFGIKDRVVGKLAHLVEVTTVKSINNIKKDWKEKLVETIWNDEKKTQIKKLVGAGKTDDALSKLYSWIQNDEEEFENIVLKFWGEWKRIDKDYIGGILTRENKEIEINKINSKILNFISDL